MHTLQKTINSFTKTISPFILLGIGVLFIRLPPIYIAPIKSSFVMSHTIARLLILLALALQMYKRDGLKEIHTIPKVTLALISFWLFSQSLSIFGATNIYSFLDGYKDIFFGIMVFVSTFIVVSKKNTSNIIAILLGSSFIHLLFQNLIYFWPERMLRIFSELIYSPYLDVLQYQFNRGRFFGDALDEVVIPLIIFVLVSKAKNVKKLIAMFLFGTITFITIASNWRSKLVVYLLALFCSIIITRNYQKIIPPLIGFILILSIIFSNFVSLNTVGTNVLDRVIFDIEEEYRPIDARFNYWKEASSIGMSSPLYGVGVGNYYDNLSSLSQQYSQSSQVNRYKNFTVIDDPHNILVSTFVSSGFLGLFAFILLFSYFFIDDLKSMYKNNLQLKMFVIIFWSIFAYSMFNPWIYFGYLGFLWFIRGVIEKISYEYS
ncbi:MAG: hypothetical protein US54_C0008G0009 [Candidatus Roizmanbacteria bacterium GW2011_GWA2_37_7]|uniref:O-antigen ligase-related domain-containing protein n=1 Tax=Candidatus Roizmanbacteria bacterium GW2011_GWA2_37_7 TaxID=1618481 RepID=A0A0G0JNQ3_9BACT|nr:MAG: hypothetical protein US54_C0008G0009 [Candidatus Roizmanbacteria bacterium GW2011_GWA2_37_7]